MNFEIRKAHAERVEFKESGVGAQTGPINVEGAAALNLKATSVHAPVEQVS